MSIACPMFDGSSSLKRLVVGARGAREDGRRRPRSARQVEANRRNARRSTGPRTGRGKQIASRNALKHGLCRDLSHLPGEEDATFNVFVAELEEELRPTTVLQKTLFPQICNLIWQLRRLPEAQTKLFECEVEKAGAAGDARDADADADGATELSPAEVLARRFSDDRSNGFLLMNRYERSMQNALLRLLRQFHWLQKHRPTTPYAPDEPPCRPERAWRMPTAEEIERQREAVHRAGLQRQAYLEREAREMGYELPGMPERTHTDPSRAGSPCHKEGGAEHAAKEEAGEQPNSASDPGSEHQPDVHAPQSRSQAHASGGDQAPSLEAKRTQTKPNLIAAGESETAKRTIRDASRMTERTQTSADAAGAAPGAMRPPEPPPRSPGGM